VRICRLTLQNFRLHRSIDLPLDGGLTVVWAENARGKSALLEAIAMLSTFRSPRAQGDVEVIARDALESEFPAARVEAQVSRRNESLAVELIVALRAPGVASSVGKRARINGVARRLADAVGELRTVLFCTDDIQVVAGSPSDRRRYLDMMLAQADREYLRSLQKYGKVLQQRNSLLKRIQEGMAHDSELAFWDEETAGLGGYLMARRASALEEIAPLAAGFYAGFNERGEQLSAAYRPALPEGGGADWAERLAAALERNRRREVAAGMTLSGPHRDDFAVEITGMPVSSFGSRGQQRTAALALKLAEAEYLRALSGEDPVLLLDDVLSELDATRRAGVLAAAAGYEQVIVTTAETAALEELLPVAVAAYTFDESGLRRLEA
jgi:DNA replication and repair protein RecF